MKTISQTYTIHAPSLVVWDALVNPKTIEKWGGGPAKMSDKEGAKFSLWGGDIHGKNVKVVKEKELVQEWYGGDWDKPSIVTFTLTQKGDTTVVELLHTDLPDKEAHDFAEGWKDYYLGPLKELVEQR